MARICWKRPSKRSAGVHGVLPGKDSDFAIMNRKQFALTGQKTTQVFTYLLAGIAGVSHYSFRL